MPKILFHKLKANLSDPLIIDIDSNKSLMDCIEKHFPMGFGAPVEMYFDVVNQDNIFFTDENQVDLEFFPHENIHIVCRPQGFDPFTLAVIAIAAVAAAVVIATSVTVNPNDIGNTKQSPNNQVNGQTNIARLGQAIPYLVGRNRSYPDLIGEPVLEYINNDRFITELFCVGLGNHELTRARQGESFIDDIEGTTVEFFQPFEFPSTPPLESFSADNITGQELIGPNESDSFGDTATGANFTSILINSGTILSQNPTVRESDGTLDFRVNTSPDIVTLAGKTLPYSAEFQYDRSEIVRSVDSEGNETITVVSTTETVTGLITAISLIDNTEPTVDQYRFSVQNFNGGAAEGTQETPAFYGTTIRIREKLEVVVGPFLTNAESDNLWIDFSFPRGLRGMVSLFINTHQVDSSGDEIAGTSQSFTQSYTGNTFDPQFRTLKLSPSAGMGRYSFSVTRTNESNSGAENPDQCKVDRLQSVRRTSVLNYGNVTWARLITRAVTGSVRSERQFNVIATKMTQTYTNGIINQTLRASRSGADSILQIFIDSNRNPSTELDLDELYGIYNGLSDPQLGYCDFTFDDEDISLRQRIQVVANASRTIAYRNGIVWEFVRDDLKSFRTFSFNRRNISSSRSHSQTWRGHLPKSFDSIELTWRDVDDSNKEQFVNLAINTANRSIDSVTDLSGRRPKRLEISGITNSTQATNRAQLEIRKLLYERLSVKDTILNDGYNVGIGDIGYWADVYETKINDGEILGVAGSNVDTSERILLESGKVYYVTITDEFGEPQDRVQISARNDTEFGFVGVVSGVIIANLTSIQAGSRYILSTETELDRSTFRMLSRSPKEGPNGQLLVDVEMIQYDERTYEFDEA